MNSEHDDQPKFPSYVRVLAILHVMSFVIGPIGFLVFAAIGAYDIARHGFLNRTAFAAFLIALACPAICAGYRQWFVAWGRRNWPDGKPE